MKFVTKGCPRCGGDLMPQRYLLSESMTCIQCGFEDNMPGDPDIKAPVATGSSFGQRPVTLTTRRDLGVTAAT